MSESAQQLEKRFDQFDQYEKFIPLDKSRVMRLGYLILLKLIKDPDDASIQNLKTEFIESLENVEYLSDDISALKSIIEQWGNDITQINVGESGTLYRFMQYLVWSNFKLGNVEIVQEGTLTDRHMSGRDAVIGKSTGELLTLDGGTSQWASAKAMYDSVFADEYAVQDYEDCPFKLAVTFDVIEEFSNYTSRNDESKGITLPKDETIKKQMLGFIAMLDNPSLVPNRLKYWLNRFKKINKGFVPEQAEDYPFARVFGFISRRKGKILWPALANHESNRFKEVDQQLKMAKKGEKITSLDHRVVQAIAMWAIVNNADVEFSDSSKKAVNKSWPEFWKFLKFVQNLYSKLI